ncbi:hypothetical protein BKH46_01565 [Helicobacter sp. 12S02634-8]|nr:hypothetical protein BKH46_01565 [Helicobacter sp. 12S02634-8]
MKIWIGSSNAGKTQEIQQIFSGFDTIANFEGFRGLEVEENGESFEENALIKARAFYRALGEGRGDGFVLADDSGLCVGALAGRPGIYSARYAYLSPANISKDSPKPIQNASDKENIACVIKELHQKSIHSSAATFVAAIALVGCVKGKYIEKLTRGELEGLVVDTPRGQNGFGYDGIFVPLGFERTLGEMEAFEKNQISHRRKALQEAKLFLQSL